VKKYDEWNEVKKNIFKTENSVYFKERDVFWASIGVNIGFEQDGKGNIFSRPVLILKKYSKSMFLGVPLSTKMKEVGMISKNDFSKLKLKFRELIDV